MRTSTRWATASLVLLALLLIGCGGAMPHIPITITIPAPSEPQPAPEPAPATNPVDYDCYMASRGTSDPAKRYDECMAAKLPAISPTVVEPAPEPERPLQNLNIVVHDARGDGIATAACSVNGDGRKADGSGFINFAVRHSVIVACSAPGFQTRSADLPPGDHRFPLASIASSPGSTPTPTPAPSPCVAGADALSCVRSMAAAHAELLTTNTFESCAEFLGHLLAALGPDYGYVGKVAGHTQHVPKGFIQGERIGDDGKRYFVTGVSHDAIKRRDGQVFDVVGNAAANEPCRLADRSKCWTPGPASVEWNVVPPQDWRKDNPFVPASAVPR